jgi:hypothetical protein
MKTNALVQLKSTTESTTTSDRGAAGSCVALHNGYGGQSHGHHHHFYFSAGCRAHQCMTDRPDPNPPLEDSKARMVHMHTPYCAQLTMQPIQMGCCLPPARHNEPKGWGPLRLCICTSVDSDSHHSSCRSHYWAAAYLLHILQMHTYMGRGRHILQRKEKKRKKERKP